ncbi:hypothetical protein ANOM_004905 [Aspergillus nomiae NRRL 13137]|uniref:Uncharacterized protein n=1 Tax=Aspergillus nomiae NRRL (strain ATCC 15546 / NRRL 13137 / CBS 260.88 / M93) TaxID=1509407 RepID=A0A0L1J4F5_ASPN3|nr:uncharacterized protein ANOM_004905 [Aspergillus nomiae NRRL 13137]KNG86550.1 hypothetical protein ANOM_004905 [Aspergillus nomiae NRRL 13137]
MRFTTIALFALSALAVSAAECGYPNGNCYDHDCNGQLSNDKITCTSGPWKGCPCGYNCGSDVGPCDANDCNGVAGRCTNKYLGCNCRG